LAYAYYAYIPECILFTLQRTIIGCNCHYMVRFADLCKTFITVAKTSELLKINLCNHFVRCWAPDIKSRNWTWCRGFMISQREILLVPRGLTFMAMCGKIYQSFAAH